MFGPPVKGLAGGCPGPSCFYFEFDINCIDKNFAYILEIHRHPCLNDGLYLPEPPIRPLWVPHELSWLEFGHVPGSIT